MILTTAVPFTVIISRAMSETAGYIAEQSARAQWPLQNSHTLGLQAKGVFDELMAVAEECRTENWDAYGAVPMPQQTINYAYGFLAALPLGTPAPSVGAEPDGHLTLEWHCSPRRTLSVSVSPEGDLHYAAIIASNKAYGTEAFFGEVPQTILYLISRVHAK